MELKQLREIARIQAMGFSKAYIEPGSKALGHDGKWLLVFVPEQNPDGRIYMVTARGELRFFKTLDAAHKAFLQVDQGYIEKLEILV